MQAIMPANEQLPLHANADLDAGARAHAGQMLPSDASTHPPAPARLRLEDLAALRQSEVERVGRINLLGEMAAGLAHEINQPLAALIYTLGGAANRAKAGALNNAQMLDALQVALTHAHRSAAILSRIRNLANKHAPHRAIVQLNDVVTEMTELCQLSAAASGVALRCETDPRLPQFQADKVQLEQVLLNLIRNAIDAVLDGAAQRWEVVVRTEMLDEGTLKISVDDSGAGMAPERMARMFEPFYTTKENGMGLGLAICRSIIEQHGGALCAENRRQGGMRVSFTLKRVAARS